MSDQSPYQTLGVTETTSFEEIQAAKQRLNQQYQGNPQAIAQVDAAYDAIIMDRLRLRQEGKIKIPETIRFPEKQLTTATLPKITNLNQAPSWLQNLIDQPSQKDILLSSGIFLSLIVIVFFSSPSLLSLLLTGGIFTNIYLLNRKEGKFGKAVLISLISLILGVLLGSTLSVLIPAISTDKIMAILSLIMLSLTSSFLK